MRRRFHDYAVDAIARELQLAGLSVATEVGMTDGSRAGRIDIVVLDGARWAWVVEVKTATQGIDTGPAQVRRYADHTGHDTRKATLIVPSGIDTSSLERAASAHDVDLWTCDFHTLVRRYEQSAAAPRSTFVALPGVHPVVKAKMSLKGQQWWAEHGRAA